MKKRSNLAVKFHIVILTMAVMITAFFYAPMDAKASEVVSSGSSSSTLVTLDSGSYRDYFVSSDSVSVGTSDSEYVRLSMDVYYKFYRFTHAMACISHSSVLHVGDYSYLLEYLDSINKRAGITSYEKTFHVDYICKSSDLSNVSLNVSGTFFSVNKYSSQNSSLDVRFSNVSIEAVSSAVGSDYDAGYQAGYSEGLVSGEANGYSKGFTEGQESVDTQSYYDSGFQAGVDSVDTQSYYDSGYQSGYNTGYQEAYDAGYDKGYDDAMSRIASWGADTTDYPKLVHTFNCNEYFTAWIDSKTSYDYVDISGLVPDSTYIGNPNHVYRYDFDVDATSPHDAGGAHFGSYIVSFLVGSCSYPIKTFTGSDHASFYISGDKMGDNCFLRFDLYDASLYANETSQLIIFAYDFNSVCKIYDMGPKGDTQNHIANQTDQLTNGYDGTQGTTVNDSFKASVNDYDTAEGSLFATATSSLDGFTFFDFESVPAMITGISFVTSIMTGIFNKAGGASGVGIILSVLFSVILVSMAVGIYKYYQSGGKGKKG